MINVPQFQQSTQPARTIFVYQKVSASSKISEIEEDGGEDAKILETSSDVFYGQLPQLLKPEQQIYVSFDHVVVLSHTSSIWPELRRGPDRQKKKKKECRHHFKIKRLSAQYYRGRSYYQIVYQQRDLSFEDKSQLEVEFCSKNSS